MMKEAQRIMRAFHHSCHGLKAAWKDAGAFRTEVILTPILVVLAFFIALDGVEFALLLGSWLLVLVAELLNTGIEAATNLACKNQVHPEAKKAKDTASAAILVACIICAITWLGVWLD